jgi:hypothetical protein
MLFEPFLLLRLEFLFLLLYNYFIFSCICVRHNLLIDLYSGTRLYHSLYY